MITARTKAYRKRHRKCDYCIHLEPSHLGGYRKSTAYWCLAKKKFISLYNVDLPRLFCRCYEVEEPEGSTPSSNDL